MVEKRERERVRKQLQRMKRKMSKDKTEEEKHLEKVNDLKRKNDKLRQRNHRLKKKSIEKIDVSFLISSKSSNHTSQKVLQMRFMVHRPHPQPVLMKSASQFHSVRILHQKNWNQFQNLFGNH